MKEILLHKFVFKVNFLGWRKFAHSFVANIKYLIRVLLKFFLSTSFQYWFISFICSPSFFNKFFQVPESGGLSRNLSKNYNTIFFWKFSTANYFRKKASSEMFQMCLQNQKKNHLTQILFISIFKAQKLSMKNLTDFLAEVSCVFRGYKIDILARNELTKVYRSCWPF